MRGVVLALLQAGREALRRHLEGQGCAESPGRGTGSLGQHFADL